ncbi:MAG: aminopeptidase P family protein [Actinomycetota bacterium]|nr:aminopeptidase P family protein [Actinomycetota bacterium]
MSTLAGVAALPPMDVAGRTGRLLALLDEAGCDVLLVTNLVDVRYLTGFTGSAGLLRVTPDGSTRVSDGRYRDQAAEQVAASGAPAAVAIDPTQAGQRRLVADAAAGAVRVGLQAAHVSWAAQRAFVAEWFAGASVVPTEGLVEGLRAVKDEGEVARLRAAAAIADAALETTRPLLAKRPTERAFALALDQEVRALGADDVSFETIVGSGPNGAKPHARPGTRVVGGGDLVVIDFGALVDGYHSDMTRTLAVGEPSATQRRMLDVVLASQAAGVAAVAAGVACSDVDRTCREVIAAAGWGDAFLHGTGHGVGLDIHEAPPVSATSTATLVAGHVVTVEPGVYLPEHGGVRIEDTVIVTEGGSRPITQAPKTIAP